MKNKIDFYKIPKYTLASKQVRFLNFILDLFFIYLFSSIVYNLACFVEFQGDFKYYSDWIDSFDMSQRFLFRMVLWFFYYGLTEQLLNRSFAKFFTKTIVVLEDGSKPRFFDIIVRTTVRLFPLEQLSFLKGRDLALHDDYSKTFVVKKAKFEISKKEFFEARSF